ncbi:MAG: hypothetical protein KME43_06410 [Myxacorys chilensis ATA2-1-KO14]|jgi:hypothetical protein|nr:hypothetical protein [Myxacorys chilensis ATA2-1-KO14]
MEQQGREYRDFSASRDRFAVPERIIAISSGQLDARSLGDSQGDPPSNIK